TDNDARGILYTKLPRIQACCRKNRGSARSLGRSSDPIKARGRRAKSQGSGNGSADVERLGAGRLAGAVERDLLDPGFGLAQQLLATPLERFSALVDRY